MKKQLRHIEDFVRSKLGLLDGDSQTDWLDFERKLRRATRIRQMKRVAGMVSVLLLLGFSQTFISGDWPLKGNNEQAFDAPVQETKSSPAEKAQPESESAKTLEVLRTPAADNQVVEVQHELPEKQKSRLDAVPKLARQKNSQEGPAKAQGPLLAMADATEMEASDGEEEPALEEWTLQEVIARPEHQAEIKNLPAGTIFKEGEKIGESPFPFDYELPKMTLSEADIKARKPGFTDNISVRKGPYISPLQEKRSWSYSLNLYPNFAFREFKIDPLKRTLLHSDFIDAMQASETSGVNINIGLEVSKRIGPITYLNTGIEYINNSYNAEFDFVNFRHANFNEDGEIINYTLLKDPQRIAFSDLNSFHFLNFPMSISYQPWASDHLRINLEFGFSLLYFLEAQGSTIDYRTLELIDLADRSYRKYMASSSLKLGVQYYLSPNMNIGLEPTLMYFTNSIYTEDYPFEVIPYSMGLNLNLQMKLQ
ncbi:hypothetical protein [Croceimicrobium sp.]|uniref:hypothetical protein n=1 Tax=Croceimicrobium sp. TaxID=2828340 RepID=UPI003BAA8AEA